MIGCIARTVRDPARHGLPLRLRQLRLPVDQAPDELTAHALVTCGRCGASLATWDAFKRLTTSIVLAEQPGPVEGASYDPLAHDSYEPDLDPPATTLIVRSSPGAA